MISIKEAFGQRTPPDESKVHIIINNEADLEQRFTVTIVRLDKEGKSFALIAYGETAAKAVKELNAVAGLMIKEIECGMKLAMETLVLT